MATVHGADDLRGRIDDATRQGIDLTVCPRSTERRGINAEQVAAIGARPRPLFYGLIYVANGLVAVLEASLFRHRPGSSAYNGHATAGRTTDSRTQQKEHIKLPKYSDTTA